MYFKINIIALFLHILWNRKCKELLIPLSKAETVVCFCIQMAPDTDLLQLKPGCGELHALTHAHTRAHAHSLGIAPTLTDILSTKKNPNQSLKCARLYQVHCLLSLNYKTTTKKGGFNY